MLSFPTSEVFIAVHDAASLIRAESKGGNQYILTMFCFILQSQTRIYPGAGCIAYMHCCLQEGQDLVMLSGIAC